MRSLPVRNLGYAIVDDDDYTLVSSFRWRSNGTGYAVTGNRSKLLHRMLLSAPAGTEVDHINHNRLDNRKDNLRVVTRQENMSNVDTGRFLGVRKSHNSDRWEARWRDSGEQQMKGGFVCPALARVHYLEKRGGAAR